MSAIPGDTIERLFTTRKFADGIKVNADSLPSGTVYKNGVANAISVTVANIETGLYKATVTMTAGAGADAFAAGDDWAIEIDATVDSVPDQFIIAQGTFDGNRVSAAHSTSDANVNSKHSATDSNVNSKHSTTDGKVDGVQTQVNKMNFTGVDIKATLDGEKVVVSSMDASVITAIVTGVFAKVVDGSRTFKDVQQLVNAVFRGNWDYNSVTGMLTVTDEDGGTHVWNFSTANQRRPG